MSLQSATASDGTARKRKTITIDSIADRASRYTEGYWHRAWRRFRRNHLSFAALVGLLLIVVFVLAAGLLSRYVTHMGYADNHLDDRLAPPFHKPYYLGADGNGRDVLTRLAYGGRVSMFIAVLASLTILLIGGTIGSVAGFFGGIIDTIGMRSADVLLSIPGLPLLILVSAFYRPGPGMLAIFIALIGWAGICRLIRGEVLSLRKRDYIEASRVIGASNSRIIWKHIIPNVLPIIIVWISIVIPGLILLEASLSYLGLGVRVPNPSWGNMLQDAKQYVRAEWTLVFIPGFAIYITVLCLYLVGNGLRDALDPRLNQ